MIAAKNTERFRSLIVIAATLVTIIFNAMAGAGYINNVPTNEPSDIMPTVITPAGYAFSIWGLIYLGLIAFSIYQALPSKLSRFTNIRSLYILSCLLNCAWLFGWHRFMYGICAVIIILLCIVLMIIAAKFKDPVSRIDAVMTKGVFGLYAGWVTAASLVGLVIYLRSVFTDLQPSAWNIIGVAAIILAAIMAVIVRWKLLNYIYPLAIAWAVTAISVKQSGNTPIVVVGALAVIAGLISAVSFVMDRPAVYE